MKHLIYRSVALRSASAILLALGGVLGLGFYYKTFILEFFLGPQSSELGRMIGGLILALFGAGTVGILGLIVYLRQEEVALLNFYQQAVRNYEGLLERGGGDRSLIGKRFLTIKNLAEKKALINQEALAFLLQNEVQGKSGSLRFLGHIFILLGMLGTIASLGVALLGTSELMVAKTTVMDFGLVISGMSTALSTTLLGLVAYILFRFFLVQLESLQNNLLLSIERVTALTLIPRLQPSPETLVPEVLQLVGNLNRLIGEMTENQEQISKSSAVMQASITRYSRTMEGIERGFDSINHTLSKGFRLQE